MNIQPFSLSYAVASSMYGCLPLSDVIVGAKEVGDGRIDLWPRHHANQREQADEIGMVAFREMLWAHEVELALTTRYDLGPFGLQDECKYVKSLGGTLVVSGSQKEGQDLQGIELKKAVQDFVERMKPEMEQAAILGMTIGIENHSSALISSVDSILWFAEYSPSSHLGLALAPYHLPDDNQVVSSLIRSLGDKLALFYAWQYGRGCMEKLPKEQELMQLPGKGEMDFRPILEALKEIQYANLVEIFMHPVPRGMPILEDALGTTSTIQDARDYLDVLVAELHIVA